MEEVFEKLEGTLKNEVKKKRQIDKIRAIFDKEDIEYDQLVATGDLAITNEKPKEDGITQGGLRTAIKEFQFQFQTNNHNF